MVNVEDSQKSIDFDLSQSHVDKFEITSPHEAGPKINHTFQNNNPYQNTTQTPGRFRDTTVAKTHLNKTMGNSIDETQSLESNDYGISESNFSQSILSKGLNSSNN